MGWYDEEMSPESLNEADMKDVVGFHTQTGVAVYCETKAIGDKLSTYQIAFLNLAKTANCFCYLATEENGKLTLKEYEQE